MFMTGPRSRHQRRCVRDAHVFMTRGRDVPLDRVWFSRSSILAHGTCGTQHILWMYDDTQQNRESVRTSMEVQTHCSSMVRSMKSTPDRDTLSPSSPSHRVWIWQFLGRYSVTGCIFVRRAVWDRVRFSSPPPPPSGTPYTQLRGECPLAGGAYAPIRTPQMHELRTSALRAPYERFTNTGRRSYERRTNLR